MNEKNYLKYIQAGDDRETAICKSIHDELGLPYPEEPDCDECPGQNECITAFIGRC